MTLAAQSITVALGRREVLHGAGIELKAGEIVAVIGPNGAGKSTLLRALSGLARPSQGRIVLDGADIGHLDARAVGRQIAYIPQDRTVHWPLQVARVVALGRLPHDDREDDAGHVASALAAMDLEALSDRPATQLSGGELARVLLARALAQQARFLIADEPTAGLDMAHVLALFSHFERLTGEGRAIVVALHDISLALRYCHRTILLKDGRVLASGASKEVVTAENLATAFGVSARIATLDHVPIVLAERTLT